MDLLQSSLDHLNPMAEAWLESKANSFSLWSNGVLLKRWGSSYTNTGETITAPILKNGEIIGELRVTGFGLQSSQGRLLADARIAAVLLEFEHNQKLLCDQLIDTRDQLVVLSSLSKLTRKIIDTNELLNVLAAEAIKLVKANEVFFLLNIEDREPAFISYPQQSYDLDYLTNVSQKHFQAGEPSLVADRAYPVDDPSFGNDINILIVPIKVYKARLAVMGLIIGQNRDFSSYEINLARAIADYAGEQIEKINLMHSSIQMAKIDTEIEMAQKIQQSLLLHNLPKVAGLDVCLAFQPASRISGDYYDLIVKPDQVVDFIIGDISGKGMPAALLMAMTLKVIRSVTVRPSSPTPDIIINQSNEILYQDYSSAVMFSTLFVCQYNQKTREIQFSNAGHSPVIYCPAGKPAEMLKADSVPVGLFPDMNCQIGKVRLNPGDILLMATDGINETSNKSNRLFGFTQLMLLVQALAHKSAKEITNGILQAVENYGAGKNQEDDRAMIVIKGVA